MNESPRTWITISKMTLHRPLLLELWFPHQQHQVIGPEDTGSVWSESLFVPGVVTLQGLKLEEQGQFTLVSACGGGHQGSSGKFSKMWNL